MQILDEELNFDDAQQCWVAGSLFSGIAVKYYHNGERESETEYVNGVQMGYERRWLPSGILVGDYLFKNGELHGISREWYDAGNLKTEGHYELGVELSFCAWDKNGSIVESRELEAGGIQEQLLKQKRVSQGRFD